MHFKEYAPRLSFLKDSASSLSSTSPSTAAYLMSVHNSIFHDELRPLNQRLHDAFCGACGSLRKQEWTKTASIRKRGHQQAPTSVGKGPVVEWATVYKCRQCRRRTVTQTRTPSRATPATVPLANPQPSTSNTSTGSTGQVSATKTAENASSKKRAKARKQGGLQALLAAKQSQTDPSQSLDLFDFLQQ